jgi:two-component system osmolarity sensor histidine kinase EnvZ
MPVTPSGLFGRTLLTLGLSYTLLAVLTFGALVHYALSPVAQRSAADLAAFMVLQAQTWALLPPHLRSEYVDKLYREHDLWLTQPQDEIPPDDYFLPYVHRVEEALAERLGDSVPVQPQVIEGRRWFWVDLAVGQNREPVRVGFPRDRVRTRPIDALLAVALGTLLLILLASVLLARQITRPLTRLGAEVEQIGRGQLPRPLPETGPRELVIFVRQFNRMVMQIQELLANRTTLLAGISHDLRTPIARMQLALEMLARQPDGKLVLRLQQDLEQMNQLIGQTLDLARNLEAGERDLVDLADLIDGLVLAQRRGGAELLWEARGPCPAEVNVSALKRILANLLENALRYGGGTAPRVELDCNRRRAEIRVLDRGPGIPEGEREAVFQPFYRLEASRSRDTGGSGLGLAIVRQLADANGLQVRLEPRPGGGTLARVRLGTSD